MLIAGLNGLRIYVKYKKNEQLKAKDSMSINIESFALSMLNSFRFNTHVSYA